MVLIFSVVSPALPGVIPCAIPAMRCANLKSAEDGDVAPGYYECAEQGGGHLDFDTAHEGLDHREKEPFDPEKHKLESIQSDTGCRVRPMAKNLPEIGQFVFHGHHKFCNGFISSAASGRTPGPGHTAAGRDNVQAAAGEWSFRLFSCSFSWALPDRSQRMDLITPYRSPF